MDQNWRHNQNHDGSQHWDRNPRPEFGIINNIQTAIHFKIKMGIDTGTKKAKQKKKAKAASTWDRNSDHI